MDGIGLLESVGLFEIWYRWLSGEAPDRLTFLLLWGHPLWWWARVGKMVQFVAALAIVAEILGPERLRNFGAALRGLIPFKNFAAIWKFSLAWFGKWIDLMRDPKRADSKALRCAATGLYLLGIVYGIGNTVLLVMQGPRRGLMFWLGFAIFSFFAGSIIGILLTMFVLPMLGLYILWGLSVLGMIIDSVLIRPLAWGLEQPYVDKLIKLVSAILLVLGFHFDLLAS